MRRLASRIAGRFLQRYTPASVHPDKLLPCSELERRHVENAKLFAQRNDLVQHFAPRLRGGMVAEVGVMYGDFSDFIIRTVEPKLFVGIDTFEMHKSPIIWGKASADTFQGRSHREFYQRRFSERGDQVSCREGLSWEVLSTYPDQTFDMIYVDGAHDYQSVKKDASVSKLKIKAEGILIFNDYIRYSHCDDCYYGVIPVVNDLIVHEGFAVVAFAFQIDMYCDIAICRRS